MGSSSDASWIVLAALCGGLYLIFDAARYFAQQVSPVTLRRWSGDPDFSKGSRWFQYDPRNLQLVSGALLQIALICAFASTIMALRPRSLGVEVLLSALIWAVVSMIWKFLLALVPDELGEAVLRSLLPFTHFFYYLFWPFLFPLRRLMERLDKRHEDDADDDDDVTDEEVQAYIDVGEEEGILEGTDGQMIQSIVDFGDRVAHELMTPRIDIVAFDAKRPLDELARMFSESKYSRIPIYTESIDSITGIVHIKEVFDAIFRSEDKTNDKPVAALARPPYFVSETKKVSELLREFQREHLQVAVVVDEFGGTAGFITIEDVVEDIVGDISDEHEDEEATLVDLGEGRYLVSGLLRVEELEETLDAELSGEDYETVAGLIFTTLGRVPKVGARVRKNGWIFDVDRADRRRIYRVKITRDPDWKSEEEES
jgi:CBS domain containing-hemolysin-like protein